MLSPRVQNCALVQHETGWTHHPSACVSGSHVHGSVRVLACGLTSGKQRTTAARGRAQRLPLSAVVSRLIDVWQFKAACEHPAAKPSSAVTPVCQVWCSERSQETSQAGHAHAKA